MAVNMILFSCVVLFQNLFVTGTIIDPKNPDTRGPVQVHCLPSDEPIQIKDPFIPSLFNDSKFIAVEWYQLQPDEAGARVKEDRLLEFMKDGTTILMPEKFSVFEFWGLQINNVDLNDSATYKAKLIHLSETPEWSVEIVVAMPPVLDSEKLSVSKTVHENNGSVTLSCGHVANLGSPPVNLIFKNDSGDVQPALYKDGYLLFTVTTKEEAEKFTCDVDIASPAVKCLSEEDMNRFRGPAVQMRRADSAETIGIIIGVVLAAAVVIVIIIIAVFILMRKRALNFKTYNEKERARSPKKAAPLLNDEEFQHERAQDPIYKGPGPSGLYSFSQLPHGNMDPKSRKLKAPVASIEDMEYVNGERPYAETGFGHFHERGKENGKSKHDTKEKKDKEGRGKGKQKKQKLPQTKPRNIFLTPSMEELDRVSRDSNSGLSIGTARQGTLV